MRAILLSILVLFVFAACSFDTGARPDFENNGDPWMVDENNAPDGAMPDQNNQPDPNDMGPGPGPIPDMMSPGNDAGPPPADVGDPDMSTTQPDMGADMQPAPDMSPPDTCTANSQCPSDQICCPNLLGGDPSCSSDCFGNGLCEDSALDCTGAQTCCEIPTTDTRQCSQFCPDDVSSGDTCTTNSDCTSPEVCCGDLQGNRTCQRRCLTGGFCENNMDCTGPQTCCAIGNQRQCVRFCL